MYAIVKTGGKQYRVEEGKTIVIEKLIGDSDGTVVFEEVLMVENDGNLRVGAPMLEGAKVTATIVEQGKGPKINGFTYKPKKSIRRRYGHRQQLTRVRINSIVA